MKSVRWMLAAWLVTVAVPLSLTAKEPEFTYDGKPGQYAVETASYDWKDEPRQREVPVKIYFPKTGAGPFSVIIFSHGLGGSREGYEYLGRHWASHGYVSVHTQHKGSDTSVWKGQARPMEAVRKSLLDLRNAMHRPFDVRFAIDQMEKMNRDKTPFQGRLDLARVGMAGHSYGAWTTLMMIGEVVIGPLGMEMGLADPRIKAAIAMSAPVIGDRQKLDRAFGKIKTPCMHMTGTLDDSPVGETKAAERRLPFDHITAGDQYLINFTGGDHMIFSDHQRPGGRGIDTKFHNPIRAASIAFWDAYLKGDPHAKEFLVKATSRQMLGKDGTLEKKLKKS